MKAIVQDRYGSPEGLQLREIDKPVPAGDQVLVRVVAAAVNARDWHYLRGDPYFARLVAPLMGPGAGPRAKIRGSDFAGVVEAVGPAVTRLRPGDEVYGDLGDPGGAFAEYVLAPPDAVGPKPANLSFEQAAAVPLAGVTALIGLRDVAQLRAGQSLLVNGASGGVGTFAVQLGSALGAEVTAVCRTRNVELVRSLGAAHIIDYTKQDFTRDGQRYDVVLDLVANRSFTALRRVVAPQGMLILSGGGVSEGVKLFGPMGLSARAMLVSRLTGPRVRQLVAKASEENLAALAALAEAGKITPVIDRTYSLKDVPEAIRYVETEHARAKVVITI